MSKNLNLALIVVGAISVVLTTLSIAVHQLPLIIATWICLGILWGLVIYEPIHSKRRGEECIHERFFVEVPDAHVTKLVEFDYGKELWNKFIHTQSHTKKDIKMMIAFPVRITSVSSSFIQGFFHKYTTDGNHTWRDIKEHVIIIGDSNLVEKFNSEINR